MSKLQVKIDGEYKDFCEIKESDYSNLWIRNLTSLKMGEFGIDTKSPEILLAYWKAQAAAGYPYAEENVRYFEDMVRKESDNAENKG